MAEGTDLAGVIGTWVAVSLALLALFGIVAPILWMRRARDERRIALSRIDDESNEIVHPRIKIPFLPAIGRTISVPKLDTPPKLDGQVRGRDDRPLDRKHSATGWLMFARTLKAYKITQHPTGNLRIYRFQSWLPVHRLWILTVGLLGRYGHRPDRGRLINAPASGRIDQRDLESFDPTALYGITGVIRYRASEFSDAEQGFGQIYFSSHDKDTRGSLQPDPVPLAVLFWSCMGCVRLLDGRVFDVSRESTRSRYRSTRLGEQQFSSSQTILPTYRFQPIENPSSSSRILAWAQILLGNLPKLWWLSEYKVQTSEEQAEIQRISGDLDDAEGISSPWIKTETLELDRYFDGPSLLWRNDVQCLALGILTMEWSPRGCLFDAERGNFCRRLLCSAASSLPALLEASCIICEAPRPLTLDRTNLIGSMKNLLPMRPPSLITSTFSRALHGTLYEFDQVLNRVYTPDLDSMAIGMIFITSGIFRSFVLSTVRDENSQGVLTLDPNSKSFTIIGPGTFSGMSFVLDFDAVFSEAPPQGPVSFTSQKVLFAALRACVRSVVFQYSLDSTDLLEFVGHMEDVVHVAAVPNAPSRARGQLPPRRTRADELSELLLSEIPSETASTDNTINSGPENDGRPRMSTPERERDIIELQLDLLQSKLSDLDNGVHELTDDTINSGPVNDERPTLSTPERGRDSFKSRLDILQSRLSDLAPADTAVQGMIDSLRATLNR